MKYYKKVPKSVDIFLSIVYNKFIQKLIFLLKTAFSLWSVDNAVFDFLKLIHE